MGIAELKISFIEAQRKALNGVSTGVVAMILKDTKEGFYSFEKYDEEDDNMKSLNVVNRGYIKEAFTGNVQDVRVGVALEERAYQPNKIIASVITDFENIESALDLLEQEEFNYICVPEGSDTETDKLVDFVKKIDSKGNSTTAVVSSNKDYDSYSVINVVLPEGYTVGGSEFAANKILPTICGILAGTPLTQSITYANVPILDKMPKRTDAEISELIDAGKITFINKSGKVKIARGVTSLKTTDRTIGESFKKIKLVRLYKFINNTIQNTISEYYVGKVGNSYDNKCLLISDISDFLRGIANKGLIDNSYTVGINIDENKKYLAEKGIDISNMTEQELKEANTGSKVFLNIAIRGVDAMEDFYININV